MISLGIFFHSICWQTTIIGGPIDTTCDAWEARIKDASRISEAALQAGLDLVKPGANEGFSACEEL